MPDHDALCAGTPDGGATISLPVLGPAKPRSSRMGPRRAVVLALVHVFILAHLAQWWLSGMRTGERRTISPLEPSESMATLELGHVNAGFVMFALALLSTFVFGRFFCGWGCHMVAMQDMCSWAMERLGVRPRPFRTRWMMLMPLVLGGYMFLWPTIKREIVWPTARAAFGAPGLDTLNMLLGEPNPRPALEAHFMVEDFWRTMPPWYVAFPFLMICGFATVYFLGSKGLCTYACPYGGLFAPMDKLSIGRIVVSDACHQCGHCTATCSSNVRVHEEVRDFGKVVDPGCLKCLDCVSVCPNGALSFSIATPALFTRPRDAAASARRAAHPKRYDATRGEEVVFGLLFLVLTFGCYRGMLDATPLLLAASLGAIGAFCAWKLWRVITTPNVRLSRLQLRFRGHTTGAGRIFALATVALLALGAWSGAVLALQYTAGIADWQVRTPFETVFATGYKPQPADIRNADRAIRLYSLAGAPREGGIGWPLNIRANSTLAWLHSVAGRFDRAELYQRRVVEGKAAIARDASSPGVIADARRVLAIEVLNLGRIMKSAGRDDAAIAAAIRERAESQPGMGGLWLALAGLEAGSAGTAAGAALVDRALKEDEGLASWTATALQASQLLIALGQPDRALEIAAKAAERAPREPAPFVARSNALLALNRPEEALTELKRAVELAPRVDDYRHHAAALARALGREDDARALEQNVPPR